MVARLYQRVTGYKYSFTITNPTSDSGSFRKAKVFDKMFGNLGTCRHGEFRYICLLYTSVIRTGHLTQTAGYTAMFVILIMGHVQCAAEPVEHFQLFQMCIRDRDWDLLSAKVS